MRRGEGKEEDNEMEKEREVGERNYGVLHDSCGTFF